MSDNLICDVLVFCYMYACVLTSVAAKAIGKYRKKNQPCILMKYLFYVI